MTTSATELKYEIGGFVSGKRRDASLILGDIVKITQKAIQIHFDIVVIFTVQKTFNRFSAWIPKSQTEIDCNGDIKLKSWILQNMKIYNIKDFDK